MSILRIKISKSVMHAPSKSLSSDKTNDERKVKPFLERCRQRREIPKLKTGEPGSEIRVQGSAQAILNKSGERSALPGIDSTAPKGTSKPRKQISRREASSPLGQSNVKRADNSKKWANGRAGDPKTLSPRFQVIGCRTGTLVELKAPFPISPRGPCPNTPRSPSPFQYGDLPEGATMKMELPQLLSPPKGALPPQTRARKSRKEKNMKNVTVTFKKGACPSESQRLSPPFPKSDLERYKQIKKQMYSIL